MNKKNLLIIAVSVLVLALIGLTYLLFSEKQTNRELVQELVLRATSYYMEIVYVEIGKIP